MEVKKVVSKYEKYEGKKRRIVGLKKITPKQDKLYFTKAQINFIHYYIEQDFRYASKAYARAYPKASALTAEKSSTKLLKKENIQSALSIELDKILRDARRPLEKRILDVWVKRAFFDPTEIVDLQGNLKISEKELRARGLQVCIDAINQKMTPRGDIYVEYKFCDRDKALDMLQKYIQMIKAPDMTIRGHAGTGKPGESGSDMNFTITFVSAQSGAIANNDSNNDKITDNTTVVDDDDDDFIDHLKSAKIPEK